MSKIEEATIASEESRIDLSRDDDIIATAIKATKQAQQLRDAAIKRLLELREQIERDLETLGLKPSEPSRNGVKNPESQGEPHRSRSRRAPTEFKGMSLAEVGKILLKDRPGMHGSEIEELAKKGGYKSKSEHFQSYLAVAFKRDGNFENIGGNRWKLKDTASASS